VVGTSGTYAPFSYFAEDGTTLQGYDVDFLNALQEVLGFEIEGGAIQDMDYGPLGTSLSQGQLDIGAAALCATDERKKSMNFTNVYYDAGIVVAVAMDNDTINGVEDLTDGKNVVAVQTGTIAYEYAATNLPESCLQAYDSQALAYKAVEDGQADATIYDLPGTAYSIKTGEVNLKVVGDEFYTGQAPYALALSFDICNEYPDIIEEFNEAIAYLEENGTLDTLKAKWCE
jgi:ABC-type amino acid transport substrate-binding protein